MRCCLSRFACGAVSFLFMAAFVCRVTDAQAPSAKASVARPNIVVIVADDLGYGEVSCTLKQEVPTPRIASLAQGGVCFTNGYVSCPYCSPTRAGLITGRYQERFGHEFNPGPAERAPDNFGLPLDQVTLSDRLKKLGYITGMVGKWHLGYKQPYHPMRRGFDEFFGFLGGAHSYIDSQADPANLILRGQQPVVEKGYLTDAFGREAVAFIDRHKQQPFFLYLPFNAVHAPLQGAEKYLARFPAIDNEKRRAFAAMLSAMDDNVGLVLDKLALEKLDDHTLIFFISDNGGPTPSTTSGNGPLRGFKAQTWEGGIRVPFMVQWKGKLPAGKIYDLPVISLDIVPTAVAAAGGTVSGENLDGVDLTPYLSGQASGPPHESLYWRFGEQWAIRKGNLKLVQPPTGGVQLYDLASDIGEQHDLATEKPEAFNALRAEYEQWNAQLKPPLWRPPGADGTLRANDKAGKAKGKARARRANPNAAVAPTVFDVSDLRSTAR
jgi:arylsulfatase A-like enzyme